MRPLRFSDGKVFGTLCALDRRHLAASEEGTRVLEVFAELLAQVFEVTEMRQRQAVLRRQALHAEDRERLRLAMELHDGLIQEIVGARLLLESCGSPGVDASCGTRGLDAVKSALDVAVQRCRDVMVRLHPDALTTEDLLWFLREQATATNPDARFQAQLPPQLGDRCPEILEALARVAQELLANVRRHAGAALSELSVARVGDGLVLTVVDRGPGGAPQQSPQGHFGLSSVRHRAETLGGTIEVHSPPGSGTRVAVRLPCPLVGDGG